MAFKEKQREDQKKLEGIWLSIHSTDIFFSFLDAKKKAAGKGPLKLGK